MMPLVLVVQVVLPLAAILWVVLWPAGNLAGLMLQVAGTGAFLFALARVAQWALPVWWLPWAYGAVWLAGILIRVPRHGLSGMAVRPGGVTGWCLLALGLGLLALGGWLGGRAMAGRIPPPVPVVDIANPFGPGRYLVGHGGSNALINGHLKTLDASVPRFLPWRGQSYAVDFFGLGAFGLRANGWRPADPQAYAIFGATLGAPCDGAVVVAEGAMPDFAVPQQDPVNRLGNHLILRCGEAEIGLAHLRQGSLRVVAGDRVSEGEPLAEVGNSGASTEPHLHIHAQRPPAVGQPPISGDPLALRIDGRFLVRGDRLAGQAW